MREIKFRAWGGEDRKYFVYFGLLNQSEDWVESTEQDEDGGYPVHDKEEIEDIQQFTGLCDKNGKEIYEGDIVRRGKSDSVVVWHEGGMGWAYRQGQYFQGMMDSEDALEIIGNIYENPELLK